MVRNFISKNPGRVFAWLLAGLLLLLILLEGWRYVKKPDVQHRQNELAVTLQQISERFLHEQQLLLDQTEALAESLKTQIQQQQERSSLHQTIQAFPQLWGAALYLDDQPIVWGNFSLNLFPVIPLSTDSPSQSTIQIRRNNNVLYWIAQTHFTIQSEDGEARYQLFTAKRIKQTNTLPIGEDREYNLLENHYKSDFYSFDIGIFDPLPENIAEYRVLHSLADDSVGTVYAIAKNTDQVITNWEQTTRFWRAAFILLAFTLVGIWLYILVEQLAPRRSLFFQLLIVGIGWLVFSQINIAENWLPSLLESLPYEQILSYQRLCNFSLNGLFFLIGASTLQQKLSTLQYEIQPNSFFSAIFAAAGAGFLNMLIIILTFKSCYNVIYSMNIPMLSLQVFAGAGTVFVYLALGIMLLALTISLIAINLFLLRAYAEYYKLVSIISIFSFLISLLISQIFISEFFALTWASIISAVFFLLTFALSFLYSRYPYSLPKLSPLRNAAIYSFIIAIAGATLIYHAKLQTVDTHLQETVRNYSVQNDSSARTLTQDILNELLAEFDNVNEEELHERISFIQAAFTQTIEQTIQNKAAQYSFDLQLIDGDGNLIAGYSTNLNSPDWVKDYSLNQLQELINIEQINRYNVRPIVQQPELIDADNYQTFYRGLLPIFGGSAFEPTAWILCSVYQERPNFDKPMRAVISELSYQDWKDSFYIQEYTNGKLTTTINQSAGERYPTYNILQSSEVQALQQDSTVYYTSTEERSYRNLLSLQPNGQVIKSSTLLPGYQTILFSFFRLHFTLLVTGFLFLILYHAAKRGEVDFLGGYNRFQYRILDSFLLATLVFLVMLVAVTHFAIQRQNRDLVEEQLIDKLDTITALAEENQATLQQFNDGNVVNLNALTDPLDVDATIYKNLLMDQSTTPQIYQQNLLPYALPYAIYNDLFINQKRNALKTVSLDRQSLLIGYRSVFSQDDNPIAVIAIPTFVQSPQFNKQLLETTSYLIILYLVVFGLFIIATTFISRQLTRPLHHIQMGLNKISKGNLDTTIPITSNDEIGSLAKAYNEMVARLKELQENLAEAEREAAWKEMAQQVAHEIKNPLTPMKLNIQHLERQLASGDYTIDELKTKIKQITQNLIVQIQSLNNIASDFSKFSKPITQEFTPVNIDKLVQSVADLYQNDDEITITAKCQASPAVVHGAQDELRRVLINLVKNAREALPHGGRIEIKTYNRQDSIFVEIEDNGEGISEEDKPKIFVPNFSTKSSGTGLGLAICKKIVEAHEGSISFASIKGKGTTFVIKLPNQKA